MEKADLQAQSLYEWLDDQGLTLEKYQDEFAVAIANPHVASVLQVEEEL